MTVGLTSPEVGYNRFIDNRLWRMEVRTALGITTTGVDDYSMTHVPGGYFESCFNSNGLMNANSMSKQCTQQAICTAADGMLSSSFVGSCFYVTDMAKGMLTEDSDGSSHCDKAVGGFQLIFAGHGIIGLAYIILLMVGMRGQQQWALSSKPLNSSRDGPPGQAKPAWG